MLLLFARYNCLTTHRHLKHEDRVDKDVLFLEKSRDFGEVAAKAVGGAIVGFVTDIQPDGCVSKQYIENKIGSRRILGRAAITGGNVALFSCENTFAEHARETFAAV